jgi:hypothetical protein
MERRYSRNRTATVREIFHSIGTFSSKLRNRSRPLQARFVVKTSEEASAEKDYNRSRAEG